jgi:hypothetical protein
MTLKHLREMLSAVPLSQEHLEIQVWLSDSSRVSLSSNMVLETRDGGWGWLIEGNLKIEEESE